MQLDKVQLFIFLFKSAAFRLSGIRQLLCMNGSFVLILLCATGRVVLFAFLGLAVPLSFPLCTTVTQDNF